MLRWRIIGTALAVLAVAVLTSGAVATVAQAGSHDSPGKEALKQLASVRQATVKYHDFHLACSDGWDFLASPYVPNMGLHFLNNNYIITDKNTFDITTPAMLLYVQRGNGKMALVAVEYLADSNQIPDEMFSGVGPDAWAPTPISGISGLHAWAWNGNPDGVFAPFNPSIPKEGAVVDCP